MYQAHDVMPQKIEPLFCAEGIGIFYVLAQTVSAAACRTLHRVFESDNIKRNLRVMVLFGRTLMQ